MTCRTNERFALNTQKTKSIVNKYDVVPLKADKTRHNTEIEALLNELGNPSGNIPFYAVYPGDGSAPIVYRDALLTQNKIIEMIEQAGPSRSRSETTATVLK